MMTITLNPRARSAQRQFRPIRPAVELLEEHLALSPTLPLPPPGPVAAVVSFHPPQPCISQVVSLHPPEPSIS
jgi:hypothetical protein